MKFNRLQNRAASFKFKKGMTLLEVLMVIALIAFIVGVVGKNIFPKFFQGKRKAAQLLLGQVKEALENYKLDCNRYPPSLDALVQNPGDCAAYAVDGYWAKKTFKDQYDCDIVYVNEGGKVTLKSLAEDCKEGGEGQASDILYED